MKKCRGILSFILLPIFCFSQNLILNQGFETCSKKINQYFQCKGYIEENNIPGWFEATDGTVDYFILASTSDSTGKFTESAGGNCKPLAGSAFAGIIPYNDLTKEYREYLGGTFSEPLKAGQEYRFSFAIQLGKKSKYAVPELEIYFSSDKPIHPSNNMPLNLEPQLTIKIEKELPGRWQMLSGTFIAKGNEKYFVLGNYKDDKNTLVNSLAGSVNYITWAYYYFDNFSLTPTSKSIVISEGDTSSFAPGKTLIAHNIYFETNKSSILANSYPELYTILRALKSNPSMKMEIDGHTDNVGVASANQKLSEDRAKAIADFFISNGIEPKRIVWKGFGSSKPIGDDNAKNRRVEFIFY